MSVTLRPLSMNDAPELVRLLNAGPEISNRTATIPYPYHKDDARQFLQRVIATSQNTFAIDVSGKLVGTIGIIGSGGAVEFGYWVGKEHWGQGYASQAVALLVERARELKISRLYAEVFTDNPASSRVLEKNGFEYEGEFDRDLPLRGGLHRLKRYGMRLEAAWVAGRVSY